jgi:hypothetical protein
MHKQILICLIATFSLRAQGWPETTVESTNYERTSTVAEISAYMDALIKAAIASPNAKPGAKSGAKPNAKPALAAYLPPNIPQTTETGKPLLAWRMHATGENPLKVYVNANIHAGEVEGKDAIQIVLREILQGKHPEIRQSIDLVACPAYNADGTDALHLANRAYQPNPKSGVGPRENIFGLDLNRDMMKAVTANAKWMLAMYRDFGPDCTIDLHATNGSRHGFHLTYAPAQCVGGDDALSEFNRRMLVEIREAQKKKGLVAYDYGNFRLDDSRQPIRWETEPSSQNMASNYPLMQNRLGILVETYAFRPFRDRVSDNVAYILEALRWMAQHKDEIQKERRLATERWEAARKNIGHKLPLKAEIVETETYTFEAYEFAADGEGRPQRNENGSYIFKQPPKLLTLPSHVTIVQTDYAAVPIGYLVDRTYQDKVVPVLEAHGIVTLPGTQRPKNEALMHFHETGRKISESAFQGVFTLALSGDWKPEPPEKRTAYSWEAEDLDKALYVPLNQPQGRLVFYLLDPRAPSGLVFWGFFNGSFIRGPGMWGEGPRAPILAMGMCAAVQ